MNDRNVKMRSHDNLTLEPETPKLLTGWVPVVKIFTTKNRAVRVLWFLFSLIMVIALVSSISVVVHRYSEYLTVIRMDQRGPLDQIPPPSMTICLNEHNIDHLKNLGFNIAIPNWNIRKANPKSCKTDMVMTWDSSIDAVSPIYFYGGHFVAEFKTTPASCYSLSVREQIPHPPDSICTTFELEPSYQQNFSYWKMLQLKVRLSRENHSFIGRPLVILHERNSFPLDNFGRYIYEYAQPGKAFHIFYSKSITTHLSDNHNYCGKHTIEILNNRYDYDQIACRWKQMCQFYHAKCKCLCPLDIIRREHQISYLASTASTIAALNHTKHDKEKYNRIKYLSLDCPKQCQRNHPIALANNTECPIACNAVGFKKLNLVEDTFPNKNEFIVQFIQSDGLAELIEEELYSLPTLFSEIGGLSSFFFGFSCMLFFELIEIALWMRCSYREKIVTQFSQLISNPLQTLKFRQSNAFVDQPKPSDLNETSGPQGHDRRNSNKLDKLEMQHQMANVQNCDNVQIDKHDNSKQTKHKSSEINTNLRQFVLDPFKLCKVDGERLSEYPKDQNSPIEGLRLSRLNAKKEKSETNHKIFGRKPESTHAVNSTSRSFLSTVNVMVGHEEFKVPCEIILD